MCMCNLLGKVDTLSRDKTLNSELAVLLFIQLYILSNFFMVHKYFGAIDRFYFFPPFKHGDLLRMFAANEKVSFGISEYI